MQALKSPQPETDLFAVGFIAVDELSVTATSKACSKSVSKGDDSNAQSISRAGTDKITIQ